MKCPICGEEMLAGGLISAGISVGWVPKDEFDKKGLRRIYLSGMAQYWQFQHFIRTDKDTKRFSMQKIQ